MLAAIRTACRRAFASKAPSPSSDWADGLLDSLAVKAVTTSRPKRTGKLHYRLLHPDHIITERALTYETCAKKRTVRRSPTVVPSPSVARWNDVFHQLDLDPRDFSTNPLFLSSFVTEMGKIKGRDQTMLTLRSQRLLGRTIRRAKMMGVIPILSKF